VGCVGTHCPVAWLVDIEELFMRDEALKLALEALELHGKQYPHMVKGY
jgi:hypothetical protein